MHLKNTPSKYVLFLGTGASISSGYPSGQELANYLLEKLYYNITGAVQPKDLNAIQNWFEKQFHKKLSLGSLMDEIVPRLGEVSIADLIKPYFKDKKISSGYHRLAELIKRGYFHVVLSMNFFHTFILKVIPTR